MFEGVPRPVTAQGFQLGIREVVRDSVLWRGDTGFGFDE